MSDELTPITREEKLLNAISEGGETGMTPITREEMYLSAIAGESDLPADMTPITRREMYLQKIYDNGGAGGGGEAEGTVEINITQNGTITRNVARYANAEITTNVPNPSTGTKEITANGDHDVTDYATAHVAVPQPSGSVTINSNGTHNVANYASASVNVPNSYSASDEGKVVSGGALVGQTSRQITANGTVDTTLNDEVVVNVPTGITPSGTKQISITENGTTTEDVTNYANAEITVNVQSSGGAEYYTGTVVFSDTDANSITFPVGVGSNDEFLFEFQLIKTGTVTDGVVTYDNVLNWHENEVVCGAWGKRRSATTIISSGYKPLFGGYSYLAYSSCASNGATQMAYEANANQLSLSENSITFTPAATSKKFGVAGVYYEYKYHVFVARNVL